MTAIATSMGSPARLRRDKAREFRLILAVAFLYFLVVSVVARLLPQALRPALPDGGNRRRSVIGDAKALAGTFVPFAFMR
ncbi:MAG: hypothetical protein AAFX81_04880 [Pseudomonadota bacterium]